MAQAQVGAWSSPGSTPARAFYDDWIGLEDDFETIAVPDTHPDKTYLLPSVRAVVKSFVADLQTWPRLGPADLDDAWTRAETLMHGLSAVWVYLTLPRQPGVE